MVAFAVVAVGAKPSRAGGEATPVFVENKILNLGNSAANPLYVRNVDYANAFTTTTSWAIQPAASSEHQDFNPPIPAGKRMVVEHVSVYTQASCPEHGGGRAAASG